jgi:Flp pilus assembly protein TadD
MSSQPHALVLRAREALARGDVRSAEAAVDERLRTAGRDINALGVRSYLLQRRGQFGEAARTLQAVIGIDPRADWAYHELIQILLAHRRLADAEQVARAGVRANPDNASCHNAFGLLLSETSDLPSGEWHLRRALALGEPQASFYANLARNLMKQGRIDEADGYFAQAQQLAPSDAKILAGWSNLREIRGDLAGAHELLDRAEGVDGAEARPGSMEEVSLLRASYLSREGRHAEALAIINGGKSLTGAAQLARGRLHECLGRYDSAWQDFVEGKRKLASEAGGLQYRADAVEALFSRLKNFFTRDNLRRLPRAQLRADLPQPVFIIGFPRSGTSLVEQILCSHSAVRAGGELPFLSELPKLATDLLPSAESFPESLAQSWTADRSYAATMFRDFYLARAAHYGLAHYGLAHYGLAHYGVAHGGGEVAPEGPARTQPDALPGNKFFTDKMPFNEIYLPLLKMAFPRAKIVHVVRHPLDVSVSILANTMPHGLNCGYRIEDITHHLAAVFDLLDHYRSEMDLGEYVVRYESLIADPAGETRRLLDYLGLPFEASCLNFYETPRCAPTPSLTRITQKLSDRAIGRHRHYVQHLRPYTSRLTRMTTAHGYL